MGILQALLQEVRKLVPHRGVKGFLQDPPSPDPVNADAYIILDDATGVWNGHDDEIARWDTVFDIWRFDDFSSADTHIAFVEGQGIWYYNPVAKEWVKFGIIGGLLHALSDAPPQAAHFGDPLPGASTEGSRADHVHALGDPGTPLPIAGVAVPGIGSVPAREDHAHTHGNQNEGGGLHALTTSDDAGFFSPAYMAQADASGPLAVVVQPHDVTDAPLIGGSTEAARADHEHKHGEHSNPDDHGNATESADGFQSAGDKTKLNDCGVLTDSVSPGQASVIGGGIGNSNEAARANHTHAVFVSNVAPKPVIDSLGTPGIQASLARSDHNHGHGDLLGGSNHEISTQSAHGFQSKDDKAKLDSTGVLSDTRPLELTEVGSTSGSSDEAARADHKHNVAGSDSAQSVHASSNNAGVATSFSRGDHRHMHGNLPGDALHAESSDNSAGFISAANHTKLVQTLKRNACIFGTGGSDLSNAQLYESLPVWEPRGVINETGDGTDYTIYSYENVVRGRATSKATRYIRVYGQFHFTVNSPTLTSVVQVSLRLSGSTVYKVRGTMPHPGEFTITMDHILRVAWNDGGISFVTNVFNGGSLTLLDSGTTIRLDRETNAA